GSSTVWLHMGAFGPRRIVTAGDTHLPAAPYHVVDNAYSLLDVSDLVFIDADAHAFQEFIKAFLTRYGRWNSPKYLFGESYGTPRSAVVVNGLETGDS